MAILTGTAIAIGAAASLAGGAISAYGAKKAGDAQVGVGRETIQYQKEAEARARADRERAYQMAKAAAVPSAKEIMLSEKLIVNADTSLKAQLDQIGKAQGVLDAIDPALKEAGAETLRLLKGEEANILKPIMENRSRAKSKLEEQLAARLGSGFRTTAAGIMALNNFDLDTGNLVTNGQLAAFDKVAATTQGLGALSANIRSNQVAQTANAYAGQANTLAQVLSGEQNIKNREAQAINAFTGMPVSAQGVLQAQGNLQQVIGNPMAGIAGAGQSLASLGAAVGQAGLTEMFSKTPQTLADISLTGNGAQSTYDGSIFSKGSYGR